MPVKIGEVYVALGANTAKFSEEMTRAEQLAATKGSEIQNTLKRLTGSTKTWGEGAGEAGKHIAGAFGEAKGAMALFEEEFGVKIPRHIRGFIAEMPGVGAAFDAAFSGLAIIGTINVLVEAGKKIIEIRESLKQMESAPERIADEFRSINEPLHQTNDELAVSNARLENEIAKLSGKPQNGLAVALLEARVEADKLADSLNKDLEGVIKLAKGNQVSFWHRLLGKEGTSDITEMLGGEDGLGGLRERINHITAEGNEKIRAATDGKSKDAAQAALNTSIQREYGNALKWVNDQLDIANKLQKEHDNPAPRKIIAVQSGVPIYDNGGSTPADQKTRIAMLEQVRANLEAQQDFTSLTATNDHLTGVRDTLQAANTNSAAGNPLKAKLAELRTELQETRREAEASGKGIFEEALAKGAGEAAKAVSELNTRLTEQHHARLSLANVADITTLETEISLTRAVTQAKTDQNKKLEQDAQELNQQLEEIEQKRQEHLAEIREGNGCY